MFNKTISKIIILLVFILIFTQTALAETGKKNVIYNGYDMGKIAVYDKGYYYVPLREFCEQVHYSVKYDTVTRDIWVYDNRDIIVLHRDGTLESNEQIVATGINTLIINGKTYIPIKFFSKGLNYEVTNNKNSLDVKGDSMYKLSEDGDILFIYTNRGVLKSILPKIDDNILRNKAEMIGFDLTSYEKYINDKNIIKEVYRTPLHNDIVDIYKYNGDNICPLLTTFTYSNSYKGTAFEYQEYTTYGIVYASISTIEMNVENMKYFTSSIAERNNVGEGMFAFLHTTSDTKSIISVTSDETMAKLGLYSHGLVFYSWESPVKTHRLNDLVTRIDKLSRSEMKFTVVDSADKKRKERNGTIKFYPDEDRYEEYVEN